MVNLNPIVNQDSTNEKGGRPKLKKNGNQRIMSTVSWLIFILDIPLEISGILIVDVNNT